MLWQISNLTTLKFIDLKLPKRLIVLGLRKIDSFIANIELKIFATHKTKFYIQIELFYIASKSH